MPKLSTIKKIIAGLHRTASTYENHRRDGEALLEQAKIARDRIGLRRLALALGIDHSTLSQVLKGTRLLSPQLQEKLNRFLDR
jgi:plasmid maintenance system antidote protein VapI